MKKDILVKVEGWTKHHIVRHVQGKRYKFWCGHTAKKDKCDKIDWENLYVQTCLPCSAVHRVDSFVPRRTEGITVGTLIKAPKEVSETGWVIIVADQRHCERNTFIADWEMKASVYDHDNPKEYFTPFNVTMKEIKEWQDNGT